MNAVIIVAIVIVVLVAAVGAVKIFNKKKESDIYEK